MVQKEFIKMPKWYYPSVLIILTTLSISAIVYEKWKVKDYKTLEFKDRIKPMKLNGDEGFGQLRGAVFFEPNTYIPRSLLVSVHCASDSNYLELNVSPKSLTKADDENWPYLLSDVRYPFTVSKESDSLIIVKKSSCELVFKLVMID